MKFTREEIIAAAKEAGFATSWTEAAWEALERFAALVAKAEAAKRINGVGISLPTETMERQFSVYHRRGYEAGKALIPAAVAAEREALAKHFEDHWRDRWTDEQIAEEIRARGNT